jgi:hypothetical protein
MGSSVSDIFSPSRQAQLGVSDQDQIHRFSDSPKSTNRPARSLQRWATVATTSAIVAKASTVVTATSTHVAAVNHAVAWRSARIRCSVSQTSRYSRGCHSAPTGSVPGSGIVHNSPIIRLRSLSLISPSWSSARFLRIMVVDDSRRLASVGALVPVGALVRSTSGQWMARPPQRCPRGHLLGRVECLLARLPVHAAGI